MPSTGIDLDMKVLVFNQEVGKTKDVSLRRVFSIAPDTFRKPLVMITSRWHQEMAKYPPKPAHSVYNRTGRYGQGWHTVVEVTSTTFRGETGNNVKYGPYVGSAKRQVSFHKKAGWRTDEDVMADTANLLRIWFSDAVNDWAVSAGWELI